MSGHEVKNHLRHDVVHGDTTCFPLLLQGIKPGLGALSVSKELGDGGIVVSESSDQWAGVEFEVKEWTDQVL